MRCAVSFLILVIISIIVCAVAVLIISLTDIEGPCNNDDEIGDSFRCADNGKCMHRNFTCDDKKDCVDGSDESPLKCQDWTVMVDRINSLFHRHKERDPNITLDISLKPDICEFHYIKNKNEFVGVYCGGDVMNGSQLTSIPWEELDPDSRIIIFRDDGLITKELQFHHGGESFNFSNLEKMYIVNNNDLEGIGEHALCPIASSIHLHWLSVYGNQNLTTIHPDWLCENTLAIELNMESNNLSLSGFQFRNLPKVAGLSLKGNKIEEITDYMFSEIPTLKFLQLSSNRIGYIHENAFVNNMLLLEVDIAHNLLHHIEPTLLHFTPNLKKLVLTENPLETPIPKELFQNLSYLISLNLESYNESQFDPKSFIFTPALEWVRFQKYSYCSHTPNVGHCQPSSDGITSNEYLLFGHTRVAIWFTGLTTIVGNSAVLILRNLYRRRSSIRDEIAMICDVFLNNLAIADLLMGIYLIVLALKDLDYAGIYLRKKAEWGASLLCTSIGILALLSSEVSLFIITLMSVERYLTVRLTNLKNNIGTWRQAVAAMVIIWLIAAMIAVAPACHWKGLYYGSSSLCFPIHLDDRYAVGWEYTAFVIVGINSICLLVIAYSYTMLFRDIMKSQWKTQMQGRNKKQNANMALRMFLIVFTDVLCWAPIILLKVAVLRGSVLSEELVSFAVIYLLPLNSAANPILYTFSTETVRNGIKAWMKDALQKLGLTRIVSPSQSNSIELQGRLLRRMFDKNDSSLRGKDQFQSNTAATEDDTELTHSACPTVNLN